MLGPVLLVDDDVTEAAELAAALEAAGYRVVVSQDSFDGLVAVETYHPALVVLVWDQPLITGRSFLAALHAGLTAPLPVIALGVDGEAVGFPAHEVAVRLPRPPQPAALLSVVQALLAIVPLLC